MLCSSEWRKCVYVQKACTWLKCGSGSVECVEWEVDRVSLYMLAAMLDAPTCLCLTHRPFPHPALAPHSHTELLSLPSFFPLTLSLSLPPPPSCPSLTVFPAKNGPVSTHTSLSCTQAVILVSTLYTAAAVTMMPGYTVPPTTRPSGYQLSLSNQFQNS